MKKIIHRADTRGRRDFGWLKATHSFSFGSYFDENRNGFGRLLVINDDIVAGGKGFDEHGHENMEIVTVPLKGKLAHKDSTGVSGTLVPGDVQLMSAGSGIRHSEFNALPSDELSLFQIWIEPNQENTKPRYQQKHFPMPAGGKGQAQLLVSPDGADGSLEILQEAYIERVVLPPGEIFQLRPRVSGGGIYLLLAEGQISVAGESLSCRDAIGLSELDKQIEVKTESEGESFFLVLQVPM